MIVCTLACANHLAKAIVLSRSVKKHNPDVTFVLFLLEKKVLPEVNKVPWFDRVFLVERDVKPAGFQHTAFKYSRYESCSAFRAEALLYLLETYQNENSLVFLDADIKVYAPLKKAEKLLEDHSILLTPHQLEPGNNPFTVGEEMISLKDGIFNGGFLGISRCRESFEFLEWWSKRLADFCYVNYGQGLFLDQKWLNLVPCFFSRYHILKHPGYNLAAWNFSHRRLSCKESRGELLVNNTHPLVFIHFSMLGNQWFNTRLYNYIPGAKDPLHRLIRDYIKEISSMGEERYKQLPWSYDYFTSGEKIDERVRARFRSDEKLRERIKNPFLLSNSCFKCGQCSSGN